MGGRERLILNMFKEAGLLEIFPGTLDLNMLRDLLVRLAMGLTKIKSDPVGSLFCNVFNGLLVNGIVGLAVIIISIWSESVSRKDGELKFFRLGVTDTTRFFMLPLRRILQTYFKMRGPIGKFTCALGTFIEQTQ